MTEKRPGPPHTSARLYLEELCKKFPDASNLGLAKRAKAERPNSFATIETARSTIRSIRGAHGSAKKKFATQPRPKGTAGQVPKMPPSLSTAWEPFQIDAKRVAIISDVHIPYHDVTAFGSAVKELKKQSPDCLLINGDFADFYQVSRHQRDPHHRRFSEELKLVISGLEWLRHEFPKARIVFKLGNHEERWDHFIWNRAPEIYDLANVRIDELVKSKQFGIEVIGDQRPIMLGKLPVLHGHELGRSIFSPVNPARGAFLRTHHTVLVGHSHQTSGHADTDMFHSETFVWSTGCLCDLTPEYARVNRWNHGFAWVDIATDGSFSVRNMRINKRGEVRGA
jgi:predicted phosphodiesterase